MRVRVLLPLPLGPRTAAQDPGRHDPIHVAQDPPPAALHAHAAKVDGGFGRISYRTQRHSRIVR